MPAAIFASAICFYFTERMRAQRKFFRRSEADEMPTCAIFRER
jgi:hypothetical protein